MQKLISDADTDEPCLAELNVRPPAVLPSDPDIAWIVEEEHEPPAALPAPEPAEPDAPAVPDAAAAIEVAIVEHEGLEPEWPVFLDGVRLTVEREVTDHAHHYFDRLKIRCNNPLHLSCGKSRSTNLQTEVFGN